MPKTSASKLQQSKVCEHCGKGFETTAKTKKYCSQACSDKAKVGRYRQRKAPKDSKTAKQKLEAKLNRFLASAAGKWIASECIRAGTVEILHGHTSETLLDLVQLHRQRSRFSGYINGKPSEAFHLSHIHPVKPYQGRQGLLHPLNLVIAPKAFNLAHKTGPQDSEVDQVGRYLLVKALQPQYKVKDHYSPQQIAKQITRLLGHEWTVFIKAITVQQTQRETIEKKLRKQGIAVPSHLSLDELKVLAGSKGINYFSATYEPTPVETVLLSELKRLGQTEGHPYGSWLALKLQQLEDLYYSFDDTPDSTEVTAWLTKITLKHLHGLPAEQATPAMVEALNNLTPKPRSTHKAAQDNPLEALVDDLL